jgi:hypothetical protein
VSACAVALGCVWGLDGTRNSGACHSAKRLVVAGFLPLRRNPIYVGFAVGWIGLGVVFGHAHPVATPRVAALALGVHVFVNFYEDPATERNGTHAFPAGWKLPGLRAPNLFYRSKNWLLCSRSTSVTLTDEETSEPWTSPSCPGPKSSPVPNTCRVVQLTGGDDRGTSDDVA